MFKTQGVIAGIKNLPCTFKIALVMAVKVIKKRYGKVIFKTNAISNCVKAFYNK